MKDGTGHPFGGPAQMQDGTLTSCAQSCCSRVLLLKYVFYLKASHLGRGQGWAHPAGGLKMGKRSSVSDFNVEAMFTRQGTAC
eukprot:1157895-Pelagomonas_calceolata.AAC.9